MFDYKGDKVKDIGPSGPVQVLGLSGAPQAGEKFKVFDNEADAKELANKRAQIERETGIRTKKHITLDEIGRRLALGNFKELNLIIKGDVDGSVRSPCAIPCLNLLQPRKYRYALYNKGVASYLRIGCIADLLLLPDGNRHWLQRSAFAKRQEDCRN